MTFAFDEQFAMFDITPVENQFILEYLPGAKGDYVKVYLYGLLCCYHPKKEMDIGSMSRELGMTENEIMLAFRYWERRGIVRRVKDHPPEWQYINVKWKNVQNNDDPDPDYIKFSREIENCFEDGRHFHGSEIAACYEWTEDMHLTTEVVIMLLKHMERTRGKNFKIKDAEKVAVMLSEEKAYTVEEAEQVLYRDEVLNTGFRKILRKMGKRFNPSDANLQLYSKWIREWHFTHEAVEAACDRMGTSEPSLALLDAILEQIYKNAGNPDATLGKETVEEHERERENLKEILSEAGIYGPVNSARKKQYEQMKALFPQSVIRIAARECAAKHSSFESVLKLLESWKERGFTQEKEILEHIAAFHEKEEYLRTLRRKWAVQDTDSGRKAVQLLDRWEEELGFGREMISLAADLAFEAKKPLAYMDKMLSDWAEQGIRTPDEVMNERKSHAGSQQKGSARTVSAQQYTQRDYTGEQEEAMLRMISMNGGDDHA